MADYLAEKLDAQNQEIKRLQEQLYEAAGRPPAALVDELNRLKDANVRTQDAYNAAWRASLGPEHYELDERTGVIYITRAAAMGGGVGGGGVRKGDPRYAQLLALVRSQKEVDAKVAEEFYRHFGWRGPVHIDYYGDTAWVTDGGRKLKVSLADLK